MCNSQILACPSGHKVHTREIACRAYRSTSYSSTSLAPEYIELGCPKQNATLKARNKAMSQLTLLRANNAVKKRNAEELQRAKARAMKSTAHARYLLRLAAEAKSKGAKAVEGKVTDHKGLVMTGKQTTWTPEQKLNFKQLRITSDTNSIAQHSFHQQARAGHGVSAGPLPQLGVIWHLETTISDEQQAAEIARVQIETKAFYDASKAQGIPAYKIMSQVLRGKTGHQYHAAKMVIQSEKDKDRAAEFKLLFPEIPNVPNAFNRGTQDALIRSTGCKTRKEIKNKLAERRAARRSSAEDVDDESAVDELAQNAKREHDGLLSVGYPVEEENR